MLYNFYNSEISNSEGIYLPKDSCSPSFGLFYHSLKHSLSIINILESYIPPADTVFKKFMIIANQAFFYCVALHYVMQL